MDYDELLNIKINYPKRLIFLTIILIIISLYIGNLKVADAYNFDSYAKENILYVNVPILYSDTFLNGNTLYIEKKKYSYEIIHIGELQINEFSNLNYQVVAIRINEKFPDNKIVKITTYGNEEKIIKKILKNE